MKLKLCLFIGLCFAWSLSQSQINLADNGLTVSGSGANKKVQFGGTLLQATTLDLGTSFTFGIQKSSASYLHILNNGNIGLGTNAPTAKFHTNGTLRFEGLLNDNSAPRVLSTDINGNLRWRDATTLGGSANIYNSNGSLTSDRTVTLGAYKLNFTSDVVVDSMRIGQGIVKNNYSLQFGVRAFAGQAGSWGNITIGTDAGRGMTTGNQNTLIGSRVGYLGPITGVRNSAYGQDVLYSLTTGNDNNIFGYSSGQRITTGINNTMMGSFAGNYITTGERNTLIGVAVNGAVLPVGSGSRNVFIGERAAYTVYGNQNVFIGWNAGQTGYDTVSNRLIINNSNSTDNLISGDFLMDTLRIGGILSVRDNPLDVDSSSKVGSTAWVKNNFEKKIQWQSLGVNQGSLGAAQVINVTGGLTASVSGNTLTINGTGVSGSGSWTLNGNDIVNANVGFVGIGTTVNPAPTDLQLKLAVHGNIYAQKLKVTQQGWADYVFETDYKLRSLSELESFIKLYKHLPDVPSAKEVETNGVDLGDSQVILLKKIEELTLYVIELKKEIDTLKEQTSSKKGKN